jgi:tripartite-type tricarboxylate transporter receptor subunit TctC
MIRSLLSTALALCIAGLIGSETRAQIYPVRPIRIIVPFPAGGPVDVMARLISQKLSANLGPVIVDNRPGGGGTIAIKATAAAEADGYTLLYSGPMVLSVAVSISKTFEADPIKPFAPVALVSSVPFVLIVAPSVPAKTVPELIAYAKANPGKLNFGAPIGATPMLVGALFRLRTGIDFVTVPYRGAANTMTDMLTGQIDMAFEPTSVVIAHLQEAKTRPLAVTGNARSPELPLLPTMIESGIAGFQALSWTGLVAPNGTPPEIVARLNRAVNDALATDDMMLALKKLGADPGGGTPQEFGTLLAGEAPKWIEVVRAAGLAID